MMWSFILAIKQKNKVEVDSIVVRLIQRFTSVDQKKLIVMIRIGILLKNSVE